MFKLFDSFTGTLYFIDDRFVNISSEEKEYSREIRVDIDKINKSFFFNLLNLGTNDYPRFYGLSSISPDDDEKLKEIVLIGIKITPSIIQQILEDVEKYFPHALESGDDIRMIYLDDYGKMEILYAGPLSYERIYRKDELNKEQQIDTEVQVPILNIKL